MREVLLDTDDLSQVVRRISADYANVRIETSRDVSGGTRLVRSSVGSLAVDHADFAFDLRYERDPSERVSVFHVRSGSLVSTTRQPDGRRFVQGDVGLAGPMQGSRSPGRSNRPATTSFSWIVRCSTRSLPAYLTMAPSRLCSRVNRLCPQAPVRIWRG